MIRTRTLCGALLVFVGVAVPAQRSWPLAEGVLAFTNVDVLTMQESLLLRDHTVVVIDGRISAIAPARELEPPRGATVIESRGLTLMPGLFDMHVHFNEGEVDEHLWLYLANGVTTVQSMHGTPRHLELRRRVAEGEVVGPRILTTGPTTARERVDSPARARAVVEAQKAAGYDAIKMYGDGADTMTRETYVALVTAAHQVGLRVVGHAPRNLPFAAVLGAGQDSIDHMEEIYYTAEEITAHFGPLVDYQFGRKTKSEVAGLLDRLDELHAAVDLQGLARDVASAGLAVTPTLVAFHTIWLHTTPQYEDLLRDPRLRYISPFQRRQWQPALNRYRRAWRTRRAEMRALLGASLAVQKGLVKAFSDAGVTLMAGTDAPLTFVFPGGSLHRELELLVECGLTPFEALRAATRAPAEFTGSGAALGTVGVGREADLVLVEGNPLDDVRNAARVRAVVARGRLFDRAALDRGLEGLAAGYERIQRQMSAVAEHLDAGEVEAAVAAFTALANPRPAVAKFVENAVNENGYALLRAGKVDEAIEVLDLNVETFPDAYNAWDSLAEAWMTKGDRERAIEFYRKSLQLNPGNDNAAAKLRELGARK